MDSVMVTGSTTIPCSADAGADVASGAGTDDDPSAAVAMAEPVVVGADACVTLGAATAEERPAAVAVAVALVEEAGACADFGAAIVAGAGCGRLATRCIRAAGLRAFACTSNCRAASRVRQYPAA
jgi:hypothetical protein